VEQIAAAAEVSPSTFFRYFPTKEDVAVYDALDPVLLAVFEHQPPELSPLRALRTAIRQVLNSMPAQEADRQRQRARLLYTIPELRTRMMEQMLKSLDQVRVVVARRTGRRPDDPGVRAFVGAVIGASLMVASPAHADRPEDFVAALDDVLAQLDAGLDDFGGRLRL